MDRTHEVYRAEPLTYIPVLLDTHDPKQMAELAALRAGFRDHCVVEDVDGHFVRAKLYSGLLAKLAKKSPR